KPLLWGQTVAPHDIDSRLNQPKVPLQCDFRVVSVPTSEISNPAVAGDSAKVVGLHRPVIDFQSSDIPWQRLPTVPSLFPVHGRILNLPAIRPRIGVHGRDHVSPGIDVLLATRSPQGAVEANKCAGNAISILAFAIDGIDWTKAPAINAAPPLALNPA